MSEQRYPTERYAYDVNGFPVFAAIDPLQVMVGKESKRGAVPGDDKRCALALACKRQLESPYASVGRSRTDVALPHPTDGVTVEGWPGKWAIYRFNSRAALPLVIAADSRELDDEPVLLTLYPPSPAERPEGKRTRNTRFRKAKGVYTGTRRGKGRGQDYLTVLGVRDLTGRWQATAGQ